jgi:hypothetical protein
MCVIALKLEGVKLPTDDHLRNCELRNRDGIGIALHRKNATEILIKKDFKDVEILISWLKENVKPEDTCMIHFRFATHGLKDEGNRHPFPITKNKEMMRQTELVCQMAMVHNGVISQYGTETKFSDTQQFVMDILAEEAIKNNIGVPAVQKLISNYIEKDRLAIMLNAGMVWMWGEWIKVDDIFYSNDSYEAPKWIWTQENKKNYSGFKNYSYKDNCDGCGKHTHVLLIEGKETQYWSLCKKCRKLFYKGKLELTIGKSLNKFDNKPDLNAEKQCESCYDWIENDKILTYYGAKICQKCMDEVLQTTYGLKSKEVQQNSDISQK